MSILALTRGLLSTPLVDVRTGVITRPWQLFFQAIEIRIGGASAPTIPDLETAINAEAAMQAEALLEDLRAQVEALEQAPVGQEGTM